MYVIVHAEYWSEGTKRKYLTQLAMNRVDDEWNCQEEFFTLVRPKSAVMQSWMMASPKS